MNINDHFQAMVFDVDGTLFDTLPSLAAAANAVLEGAGLRAVAPAMLRPALSDGLVPLFRRALALQTEAVPDEAAARLQGDYLALYLERGLASAHPFEGAAATLEALAAQGLRLGICTNRDRASTDALLAAAAFPVDFDVIVGLGDAAQPKPAPEPLLRVLQQMGVPVSQALFIGDSGVDARCAQAAQVRFAAHLCGYAHHPSDLMPQVVGFTHYEQLTPWVLDTLRINKKAPHA